LGLLQADNKINQPTRKGIIDFILFFAK